MAPQKYTGQAVSASVNGKSAATVCSSVNIKKPRMEQIQADHELFLQAFESKFIIIFIFLLLNQDEL